MDALSKMRKAAVTLPSWEQVNILRDPPKSIHTRKKERVEAGDVTHQIREMNDRINDAIRYYPTGVNPMVSVSYGNTGGASRLSSGQNVMAHNPYKVMREGAFRPPMFRQEDILPLSRQKRRATAVQTRPGVDVANFHSKNLTEKSIDTNTVRGTIRPTTTRDIAGRAVETYVGNTVLDPLAFSVITSLKGTSGYTAYDNIDYRDADRFLQEKPLTSVLTKGYTVQVFDTTSRVMSEVRLPEKSLDDIVATAQSGGHIQLDGPNGQPIKLKEYTYKVVKAPKTNKDVFLIEFSDPDIELERNVPLHSVNARIMGRTSENPNVLEPILENNRPIVSAFATPGIITGINTDRSIKAAESLLLGGFAGKPSVPTVMTNELPKLQGRKIVTRY